MKKYSVILADPPAPIQGVEDMWFIGCESWQTEDE